MGKRNRKRYLFTSDKARECQLISTEARRKRKEEYLQATQHEIEHPSTTRYNLRDRSSPGTMTRSLSGAEGEPMESEDSFYYSQDIIHDIQGQQQFHNIDVQQPPPQQYSHDNINYQMNPNKSTRSTSASTHANSLMVNDNIQLASLSSSSQQIDNNINNNITNPQHQQHQQIILSNDLIEEESEEEYNTITPQRYNGNVYHPHDNVLMYKPTQDQSGLYQNERQRVSDYQYNESNQMDFDTIHQRHGVNNNNNNNNNVGTNNHNDVFTTVTPSYSGSSNHSTSGPSSHSPRSTYSRSSSGAPSPSLSHTSRVSASSMRKMVKLSKQMSRIQFQQEGNDNNINTTLDDNGLDLLPPMSLTHGGLNHLDLDGQNDHHKQHQPTGHGIVTASTLSAQQSMRNLPLQPMARSSSPRHDVINGGLSSLQLTLDTFGGNHTNQVKNVSPIDLFSPVPQTMSLQSPIDTGNDQNNVGNVTSVQMGNYGGFNGYNDNNGFSQSFGNLPQFGHYDLDGSKNITNMASGQLTIATSTAAGNTTTTGGLIHLEMCTTPTAPLIFDPLSTSLFPSHSTLHSPNNDLIPSHHGQSGLFETKNSDLQGKQNGLTHTHQNSMGSSSSPGLFPLINTPSNQLPSLTLLDVSQCLFDGNNDLALHLDKSQQSNQPHNMVNNSNNNNNNTNVDFSSKIGSMFGLSSNINSLSNGLEFGILLNEKGNLTGLGGNSNNVGNLPIAPTFSPYQPLIGNITTSTGAQLEDFFNTKEAPKPLGPIFGVQGNKMNQLANLPKSSSPQSSHSLLLPSPQQHHSQREQHHQQLKQLTQPDQSSHAV